MDVYGCMNIKSPSANAALNLFNFCGKPSDMDDRGGLLMLILIWFTNYVRRRHASTGVHYARLGAYVCRPAESRQLHCAPPTLIEVIPREQFRSAGDRSVGLLFCITADRVRETWTMHDDDGGIRQSTTIEDSEAIDASRLSHSGPWSLAREHAYLSVAPLALYLNRYARAGDASETRSIPITTPARLGSPPGASLLSSSSLPGTHVLSWD
jgi:hypothetical protein